MGIRWKLLLLLLAVALAPLAFASCYAVRSTRALGRDLASSARLALFDNARAALLQLVNERGDALRREVAALETALQIQARAVERLLAAPPPAAAPVFYAEDYDAADRAPDDLGPSPRHLRERDDSPAAPMPISMEQQVICLAGGVDRARVANDVARVSTLTPLYKLLHETSSQLVYWQYTALESGVHSSYPGHGGYPRGYDPRQRPWYVSARDAGALVWNRPFIDAPTRQVIFTLSAPVQSPAGAFAGVTAIDVLVTDLVRQVKLPPAWSGGAQTYIVREDRAADVARLIVLAQREYADRQRQWDVALDVPPLTSEDAAPFNELLNDIARRRSGAREMRHAGQPSIWAYGPVERGGAYLVIAVPLNLVLAQAEAAENRVLDRTQQQFLYNSLIFASVIAVVAIVSYLGSRSVTEPVRALAEAARRLAGGDFDAAVPVRTTDELGELGQTFNRMAPQLRDVMRLRESLNVAMEVQQNLLPRTPPQIAGLDVAGKSDYCDETGGDYFDFIDFSQIGPHTLGVAIGDVTGHGIAAALLMATARALLRGCAEQHDGLAELVGRINAHLAADTPADRFMTLFLLLVDAEARTARWVSAGHDPAITYEPARDAFGELSARDIPLGIDEAWRYQEHSAAALPAGLLIVLGTDGIWESRNPRGEPYGKQRLRDAIRAAARSSASEISAAITRDVERFCGARTPEDDVTLVVIKMA